MARPSFTSNPSEDTDEPAPAATLAVRPGAKNAGILFDPAMGTLNGLIWMLKFMSFKLQGFTWFYHQIHQQKGFHGIQ